MWLISREQDSACSEHLGSEPRTAQSASPSINSVSRVTEFAEERRSERDQTETNYATWITRPLVGERSCLWALWFKTSNQDFKKTPNTFDSGKWNMGHTDLMNELADRTEARSRRLFIERQNEFKTTSPHSGLVIRGRPDIIAVDPNGVKSSGDMASKSA